LRRDRRSFARLIEKGLVQRIEQPLRLLDPLRGVCPPFVLSTLLDAVAGS
jgi:hypothetical protein